MKPGGGRVERCDEWGGRRREGEARAKPGHQLVGPVPARYVRQSQLCPQLDVSDKNDKKTQDMSDRARYVRQKL